MNAAAPAAPRRWRRLLIATTLGLLLLAALLVWLAQPPRAVGLLLQGIGSALELEIHAGRADYRLRGNPQLLVHDLVVRRYDKSTPLLRAERALLALPWRTIRSAGDDLVIQRIELDAPQLNLPELQHWLASRPPGETRIPTLSDGLRIVHGRVDGDAWRIDNIHAELPLLASNTPIKANLRGRYVDPTLRLPFDFKLALSQPANNATLNADGSFAIETATTKLPATLHLSGALHRADTTYSLQPATLRLHGEGLLPTLDARGAVALGPQLALHLHGQLAAWPPSWPTLPPPLSESNSPLPFKLDYSGALDFSAEASLALHRDATVFDAHFRLPGVRDWLDAGAQSSPLPPLQGKLATPRLEVSGATLEGVEISIDDTPAAHDEPPAVRGEPVEP